MTDDWYKKHSLIHYTKSEECVASILEHGFLLVPNKRYLINQFLPNEDFSNREPQEFGMVSFTELPVERARYHREMFGDFGICVTWEWALRNGAQRVMYVGETGEIFENFAWLFQLGSQELKGVDGIAKTNKALAAGAFGAQLYHALLTLYEYMEPERNSSQVEWRIVNKLPISYNAMEPKQLIAEILHNAKTLKICNVPITPDDIELFICPPNRVHSLQERIPTAYKNVPIYSYARGASWLSLVKSAFKRATEHQRKRDRYLYRNYEPPKGSLLLQKSTNGGALLLPTVTRIQGLAFYPDAVLRRSVISIQYQNHKDEWFELHMPLFDGLYLLNMLRAMEQEHGLDKYNRPPQKDNP